MSIGGGPYLCTSCGRQYERKDYLERHRQSHHGESVSCPLCSKIYARPDILRRHILTSCKAARGSSESELQILADIFLPRKRSRRTTTKETTVASHLDTLASTSLRPLDFVEQSSTLPPSSSANSLLLEPWDAGLDAIPPVYDSSTSHTNVFQQHVLSNGIFGFGQETGWNSARQSVDSIDDLFGWLLNSASSDVSDGTNPLNPEGFSDSQSVPDPLFSLPVHNQPSAQNLVPDGKTQDFLVWTDKGAKHSVNSSRTVDGDIPCNPAIGDASAQSKLPLPIDMLIGHADPPQSSQSDSRDRQSPSSLVEEEPPPVIEFPAFNQPAKRQRPSFSDPKPGGATGELDSEELIDQYSREQMLDVFEPRLREDVSSFFSLARMKLYLELFFEHFASMYPIVHRPSLHIRTLPPDLVLIMICVGTAFAAERDGLQLASRIHRRLRNRVMERVEDQPRVDLASLQTILLANHFSRSYGSIRQHDVSQIFHSPSIIMARLSGVFLSSHSNLNAHDDTPRECWLQWIQQEERIRLGWFAFIMDTENAALYRHWPMTHIFSMQIPFPSNGGAWSAPDPYKWSSALNAVEDPPPFRHALRELAGKGRVIPHLDIQALWIIPHAIISISWALVWRDLSDLSMVHESKIIQWKNSLRDALDSWRVHVEAKYGTSSHHTLEASAVPLHLAGITFAHMGCILLTSDLDQLRIFAGLSENAGNSVTPIQRSEAIRSVNVWARSQDGAHSYYAAIDLLTHVFKWSGEQRFQVVTSNIGWCIYIASLAIWAYASLSEGQGTRGASYILINACNSAQSSRKSINVEPFLARRDALTYLDRFKGEHNAFARAKLDGKNRCAGVMGYTAYLVSSIGGGVLEEAYQVLETLIIEHGIP